MIVIIGSNGPPHMCFFVLAGDTDLKEWGGRGPFRSNPLLPSGWTACSVTLTHCEAGGGTTGRWTLVAWYPPGHKASKPAPISPQPWFPIRAFVNDRAAATPVPVAEVPADLPPTPSVVRSGCTPGARGVPPGGIIHQWGLFPASDLGARVLLASSGCPSGWGDASAFLVGIGRTVGCPDSGLGRLYRGVFDLPSSGILCLCTRKGAVCGRGRAVNYFVPGGFFGRFFFG
jgi:hypothetical protein